MSSSVTEFPEHTISIVVGGVQLEGWETYEIHASMLELDSHFSVRMPFSLDVWNACKPDLPITVLIDDIAVLTGNIDERLVPEDDEAVEIVGRSKGGRLEQESAPSINFANLGMFDLIKQVVAPVGLDVNFSNAANRRVLRGRGKKAKAAGEPIILKTKKVIGTRIEPGQSRAQVIVDLCQQAGYAAWITGDGEQLIVGEPNYDQEIQWTFFMPKADSTRGDESTVLGMGVRQSTADRYSRIICVGSGVGTDVNYGPQVAARYADAKNNPATPDGDGLDFSAPKILIVVRAAQSALEAKELAVREMAKRDVEATRITVRAPRHGQMLSGSYPTIFCPDTLALVEDERTGVAGIFMVTSCVYRDHRKEGSTTTMELVKKGSLLIA